MTVMTIAPTPLVYNGEVINSRDEMLSLTDMWRASDAPQHREPYNWSRKEGRAFVEAVAFNQNLPEEQVLSKRRGKSGGTWAHWQIALAYAKYLSPKFHIWCNEVVRDRMEGRVDETKGLGAREVHMTFRAYQSIGRLIGFSVNEAALAANRATIKTTGIDALGAMGVTHLLAETQEEMLTPTIIGQRLEGLSAQSVNKRLEALGFQEAGKDSHGQKTWHPTDKGKPFGRWFDASKAHKDGASIQQWKWFATIVDEIRGGAPVAIVPGRQGIEAS